MTYGPIHWTVSDGTSGTKRPYFCVPGAPLAAHEKRNQDSLCLVVTVGDDHKHSAPIERSDPNVPKR